MYQPTQKTRDWLIVISALVFLWLLIPFSDILFANIGQDTADASVNILIDIIIGAVFVSLFIFLRKKGPGVNFLPYLFLFALTLISVYFLMRVQVTRERLHFLSYGILSLLLYRALRHNMGTQMLYVWALSILVCLAFLDELLQLFTPGRNFELKDISIDFLSSLIGQCIIALVVSPPLVTIEIKLHHYLKGLKDLNKYQQLHRLGK